MTERTANRHLADTAAERARWAAVLAPTQPRAELTNPAYSPVVGFAFLAVVAVPFLSLLF